jgi:hypothetical protein
VVGTAPGNNSLADRRSALKKRIRDYVVEGNFLFTAQRDLSVVDFDATRGISFAFSFSHSRAAELTNVFSPAAAELGKKRPPQLSLKNSLRCSQSSLQRSRCAPPLVHLRPSSHAGVKAEYIAMLMLHT